MSQEKIVRMLLEDLRRRPRIHAVEIGIEERRERLEHRSTDLERNLGFPNIEDMARVLEGNCAESESRSCRTGMSKLCTRALALRHPISHHGR